MTQKKKESKLLRMEAEKNFLLFHLSALFLQFCSGTQFHSYQQLRFPVKGYIKLIQNTILRKKFFISRPLGIFGQNSDNKEY